MIDNKNNVKLFITSFLLSGKKIKIIKFLKILIIFIIKIIILSKFDIKK